MDRIGHPSPYVKETKKVPVKKVEQITPIIPPLIFNNIYFLMFWTWTLLKASSGDSGHLTTYSGASHLINQDEF